MRGFYFLTICIAFVSCYKTFFSKFQQSVILPVLGKIDFKANEKVLLVGCDNVRISSKIAAKVPMGEVAGINISEKTANIAKGNFSGVKNLSFKVQSIYAINLKKKFDQIFSFFVFHWIKDKISAFSCIKKVLKPGGRVHIVVVHPENSMSAAFNRLKGDEKWKIALENRDKNFHASTEREYKKTLGNLDFKDLKIDVIDERSNYKDFSSFVDYIMTWLPFCVELQNDCCLELAEVLAKDIYNQLNVPITHGLERSVPFFYIQAII